MSKSPLIYKPDFISVSTRLNIVAELKTKFFPIWENRYSASNPPPPGRKQRRLLRPVYWLGNWQFACLDYYHPPKGIHNRCVQAEEFPPALAKVVARIEALVKSDVPAEDVPLDWRLNTCLINYYGQTQAGTKIEDLARVGEHKDFEPGPVASLSLGESALFQFVASQGPDSESKVVLQQWLEDGSLQVFAGDKWKKKLFHRVQRVEKKKRIVFEVNTEEFETRRVNFTFRFVPQEHILPLQTMPIAVQADLRTYVQKLSEHSEFWRNQFSALAHYQR